MKSLLAGRSARCLSLPGVGLVFLILALLLTPQASAQQSEVVLEDYSDIVTRNDLGFNDFSGNAGDLNKDNRPYGAGSLACAPRTTTEVSCSLQFDWNFAISADREAFTGLFYSLFGLTDTQATFDSRTVTTVSFPEHSLDLDQIDGALAEPAGPRSFAQLRLAVSHREPESLTLRVEVRDTQGGGRFTRFRLSGSPSQQVLTWSFRDPSTFTVLGGRDLNLRLAKVLSLVIERSHAADRVQNPDRGSLQIHRLWFVLTRPETDPPADAELLDALERRAAGYFLDWASRKPDSLGIPQDRSTLGDLLTVGGIGFALPAYVIAAERGWISRADAAARSLAVLRALSNRGTFGPERTGRIGHRGWFYHFLGPDGRRKLNFDFRETERREDLNTVERVCDIEVGIDPGSFFVARTLA